MSTPASSREPMALQNRRVTHEGSAEAKVAAPRRSDGLKGHVVLVGHRGAGKTTALRPLAERLGRPAVDLDALIAEREGTSIRELFARSEATFRAAERAAFLSVRGEAVISAGGGFLANHADLLDGHTPVLVPIDFETYRERLLRDRNRPRLRPELPLDEEIATVFAEREKLHARVKTVPLSALLPTRPLRVVTLPRSADALAFASKAKALGADVLEVRDDLTDRFDAARLAKVLPLMLSHRSGSGFTAEARRLARWEDSELGPIVSHHFDRALTPDEAEAHWASSTGWLIKHVELGGGPHLLETQRRLIARFGDGRVTVLAMGPTALPWRALLAERNAFDYLAVDEASASAPGQRLLADAVRGEAASGARLGILGSGIAHSRSPRIHPQPFDRVDLPADCDVAALVERLLPYYRGFAVTAPFKGRFDATRAVNTLVRGPDGWRAYNTDVEGARAVLERHGVAGTFTVLGDGGATWALRKVAGARATVVKAADVGAVTGDVVWTWPEHVPVPPRLRLDGARVLVIAYGPGAKRIAARIALLGGTPVRAGATWFVAQARAQRSLWSEAS